MGSNYPPGVTGNEYEIAGPDREEEQHRPCFNCSYEGPQVVVFYRHEAWFFCENCGQENNISEELVDEEEQWLLNKEQL